MASKLAPVGSQFQVNLTTLNNQSNPDVALFSDGRFVVVYEDFFAADGTDIDILAQFVDANGTLSGNTISLAFPEGVQTDPALAARGDGGFTTVWRDFGTANGSPDPHPDIHYAVTNSAGRNTVTRTLLMDLTSVLLSPAIATMPDGRQVVVTVLNSAGALQTAPQSVATVSNIFHVDGTGDLNGDEERHHLPRSLRQRDRLVDERRVGAARPTAPRFHRISRSRRITSI